MTGFEYKGKGIWGVYQGRGFFYSPIADVQIIRYRCKLYKL